MGTTDSRGGLVPKHLDSENLGTEIDSLNFATEWQDGPSQAGRAVIDLLNRIESLNSVTTQQDGPSQARRAVTSCVTLTGSDFYLSFTGVFWTISAYDYKVSGLMLIIQLLGGKRR